MSFPGSSCETPIIFQSETRDSSDVEITNLGIDATVLTINGADGLIFRDLTLHSVNPAFRRAVDYSGGADCIEFYNNELEGYETGTSSATTYAVVYSLSGQDSAVVFRNNYIHGGSYGFYILGGGVTNSVFENNVISDVYRFGIRLSQESGAKVNDNIVYLDANTSSSGLGIQLVSCDGPIQVQRNFVDLEVGYYGISLLDCIAEVDSHGLVANNMASVGGTSAAYPYVFQDCENQDIAFNSGHTYSNDRFFYQQCRTLYR